MPVCPLRIERRPPVLQTGALPAELKAHAREADGSNPPHLSEGFWFGALAGSVQQTPSDRPATKVRRIVFLSKGKYADILQHAILLNTPGVLDEI